MSLFLTEENDNIAAVQLIITKIALIFGDFRRGTLIAVEVQPQRYFLGAC